MVSSRNVELKRDDWRRFCLIAIIIKLDTIRFRLPAVPVDVIDPFSWY